MQHIYLLKVYFKLELNLWLFYSQKHQKIELIFKKYYKCHKCIVTITYELILLRFMWNFHQSIERGFHDILCYLFCILNRLMARMPGALSLVLRFQVKESFILEDAEAAQRDIARRSTRLPDRGACFFTSHLLDLSGRFFLPGVFICAPRTASTGRLPFFSSASLSAFGRVWRCASV